MTDRILPPDEWGRLAGTPLGAVVGQLNPATTAILVVEDEAGAIVGCWATLWMLHAEGFWITEAHRRKGGVFRRLLRGMRRLSESCGVRSVVTAASVPEIADFLKRFGATPVPAQEYFLCLSR